MQSNLNAYDKDNFQKRFPNTKLGKHVIAKYDYVSWEYSNVAVQLEKNFLHRYQLESKILSAVPYYYLEYLLKHNPTTIYDLGCGNNVFKANIPNIVGLDPTFDQADIKDYVDDDYIAGHQNYFESMFAINSLHFFPMRELRNQVQKIVTMMKPGARCFLALNVQRMLERDDNTYGNIEQYVRTELYQMDFEYEVFDFNIIDAPIDEYLDGNIRMVCHRI